MSDLKLGEVITDTSQQRDAIHIAVAPVIAAKQLHAGQHVGFVSETEVDTIQALSVLWTPS